MFCPQCGAQVEHQTRFCRSCGLKLSDHAQLLSGAREPETRQMNSEEAGRELRVLKGTKTLTISLVFLPISLGLAFLQFYIGAGRNSDPLILLVLFLFISLGISSLGLINLIRGGFFNTFKKRSIRAEAILLDQQDSLPKDSLDPSSETNRISPPIAGVSITEHTTRQLQPSAGDSGKIS
jgi:hypothetical protein